MTTHNQRLLSKIITIDAVQKASRARVGAQRQL